MRFIQLVLCVFSVATFAQDQPGYPGYFITGSAAKSGGWFYVHYNIDTSMLVGPSPHLYLTIDHNAVSAESAHLSIYAQWATSPPPFTAGSGNFTTLVNDVIEPSIGPLTVPLTQTGVLYIGVKSVSCTVCVSTADIIVNSWIRTGVAPADVPVAFTIQNNPYTSPYSTAASSWGNPAGCLALTATTNIYVKTKTTDTIPPTYVVGFQLQVNGTAKWPTVPVTINTASSISYPTGTPYTGNIDTGAVSLTAGTWCIDVYVTKVGTGNSGYSFAVGIGAEPSAASVASPLVGLLVALAALAVTLSA